jgi:hypothetical protein
MDLRVRMTVLVVTVLLFLGAPPPGPSEELRPPAPELHFLEPMQGRWKVDVSLGRPGPDQKHVPAVCQSRFILAGRFLQSECAVGEADARREAWITMGYDERKRQFFAVIFDSQRGFYFQPWGHYDQTAKSFILSGKERDENSGMVGGYRLLWRIEGPDRLRLEAYLDAAPARPLRVVEAIYTRED